MQVRNRSLLPRPLKNPKQLSLLTPQSLEFGGSLLTNKRKSQRVLAFKKPIHLVLKGDTKKSGSLLKHRKTIKEQWDESRILDKVFEFFSAVELNPEQKLQFVGHGRINYQKAKFLFVDKLYQNIYGIDWGHEVGRYISDFFIRKIEF